MSYLRHISTRRLLVLVAACLLAAGTGAAAIALAAGGAGPTPPPKALAQAIHDALAAPPPAGITARISFTNHLVDSASLQGTDPILTGATGRLWASGDRLRLELQASDPGGGGGDVQVLLDNDRLTVIDTGSNTVYRLALPHDSKSSAAPDKQAVPALARIQQALAHVAEGANVSGAQPDDVAGRPAYTVRVSPKHDGGLLGAAELSWDAERGVPLRAAVFASGGADPVLELTATDISFGPIAAGDLTAAPPPGAKVVDVSPPATGGKASPHDQKPVTGLEAVQAKVPFKIAAPDALVGVKRQEVRLVDFGGEPGALVTYGQGLGGIAVLQTAAEPGTTTKSAPNGLSLPKISINGASGTELDTALGTLLRFERAGVAYTVVGSVPPAAAEAAARAL